MALSVRQGVGVGGVEVRGQLDLDVYAGRGWGGGVPVELYVSVCGRRGVQVELYVSVCGRRVVQVELYVCAEGGGGGGRVDLYVSAFSQVDL